MAEFPAAQSHGPIEEPFPNIFRVPGTFRIGPGVTIPRNMTILRQGKELVVLNSVRLSAETEAELEKLGKVTHLVRLGAFHGLDDPYYVDRFSAKMWAPPKLVHQKVKTDEVLRPDNSCIEGAEIFLFENGKHPEASVLVQREGGVLVPCDCYQNWTSMERCSFLARVMLPFMGFGPTVIGKPWTNAMGPSVRKDLDRLADKDFMHLLPVHGDILKSTAKEGLRKAIDNRFGGKA